MKQAGHGGSGAAARQQDLSSLLYAALASPIGILLRCSDLERTRQALYQARTKVGDGKLAGLQIRVSPFEEGDLVICHQRILLAATGGRPLSLSSLWPDKEPS